MSFNPPQPQLKFPYLICKHQVEQRIIEILFLPNIRAKGTERGREGNREAEKREEKWSRERRVPSCQCSCLEWHFRWNVLCELIHWSIPFVKVLKGLIVAFTWDGCREIQLSLATFNLTLTDLKCLSDITPYHSVNNVLRSIVLSLYQRVPWDSGSFPSDTGPVRGSAGFRWEYCFIQGLMSQASFLKCLIMVFSLVSVLGQERSGHLWFQLPSDTWIWALMFTVSSELKVSNYCPLSFTVRLLCECIDLQEFCFCSNN